MRHRPLRRILAFLVLLLPSLKAFPVSTYDARGDISIGDQLYRNFDNFAALERYRAAHEAEPDNAEALIRMARIHNDIGRSMLWRNDSAEVWYRQAVAYAEALLEKYPEKAESHFWIALTKGSLAPFLSIQEKLDVGKFVVHHARKAIEIDTTFGPAYVVLGILYREAAKLKWYERVIANVVFGGSLPGTIEDSEQALQRALELNPNDIFAHFELAQTYHFLEDHDKAMDFLERSLVIAPASARERDQLQQNERRLQRMKTGEPAR